MRRYIITLLLFITSNKSYSITLQDTDVPQQTGSQNSTASIFTSFIAVELKSQPVAQFSDQKIDVPNFWATDVEVGIETNLLSNLLRITLCSGTRIYAQERKVNLNTQYLTIETGIYSPYIGIKANSTIYLVDAFIDSGLNVVHFFLGLDFPLNKYISFSLGSSVVGFAFRPGIMSQQEQQKKNVRQYFGQDVIFSEPAWEFSIKVFYRVQI